MIILYTALAIAGAPAPASSQAAAAPMQGMQAQHARQSAPGAKPSGDGCPCCKQMAGGGKMECCAKHGDGAGAKHSGQSTNP